jgi:septal ring factor EnvC (AmiA/AmiB activator)
MFLRPLAMLAVLNIVVPAVAQDVRGLEVCTAEKVMERRTSCLQSNVEFLQQTIARTTRETGQKLEAAAREISAQKAEIASLKAAVAKLQQELAEFKKEKDAPPKK